MVKISKALVGSALAATLFVAPFNLQVSAERGEWMPIEVNLDGKILDLPTDPVIKSGTTLVPMRAIFEVLGAKVTWDAKTKKVEAVKDSTTIELTIGSKSGKVNGKVSEASVPPQLVEGNTLIPLRYVSEAMGMHVAWVESERQVFIAQDKEIEGTTMASVTALYNKYAPTFKGNRYSEQPSYSAPYKAGKLSDGFLQDGLKSANFIREMADLPILVLDDQLNEQAAYGAMLLQAANEFSHAPSKPSDMSEDVYKKGFASTKSSNIHMRTEGATPVELSETVKSMVNDAGVADLGHRKWVLNPKLYKVGFGYGSDYPEGSTANKTSMSLMQVFDESQPVKANYDYISWPSKGYFPIQSMELNMMFSVSLNPDKYQTPDYYKLSGTVTNKTDGSVFKLTPDKTEGFYLHPAGYGSGPVISFPYRDEDKLFDAPKAGDEYVVEISGVNNTNGTPATIKYTVKLFAL
ncbi:stalk domain-containing protein [Paenibacillus xylanilyticus]|uniref:Copper amine oxidase N-terminal domain-containing protein n=1 Tax=Paenibacillus xylanilyticus TaxID=248903 RepID=A0A7Y6ET93_9BACL|nr:stalk domain-containing protein [Paenibacillus xylanilyticus]NUU75757.1 hypothetical protein [Paenibacillus xylanilyticus]